MGSVTSSMGLAGLPGGTGALTTGAGALIGGVPGAIAGGVMGSGEGQKILGGRLNNLAGGVGSGANALGIGSGSAPTSIPITPTGSTDLLNATQGAANNSVTAQQNLVNALQGQNALGQQTQSLNAQNALAGQLQGVNGAGAMSNAIGQQGNFNGQLGAANGIGTQNQAIQGLQGVAGQQAATEQQYQNIANGTGPNPAQAMLNQQTGANVANQAALMAGQRGAGANIGLMARQAAQQGAATQQQAVGQGATMQAQQQLGALSGLSAQQQALAGTQSAIGGLGTTQAGMQQAGISNLSQQGAQAAGLQQGAINAAAGQANTMAGQQIGATTAAAQGTLANAGQAQQGLIAQNNANVSMQGNVNAGNTALEQTSQQGRQGLAGGVLNGLGAAVGAAHGGEILKMDDGGPIPLAETPAPPVATAPAAAPIVGPQSSFGQFLKGFGGGSSGQGTPSMPAMGGSNSGAQAMNAGMTGLGKGIGKAAKKPKTADLSSEMETPMAKGGLAAKGGHVAAKTPGQKPVVKGDSLKNDKVPTMLSAGEVVIPRSIMNSKNPARSAADFVNKVLAKRKA